MRLRKLKIAIHKSQILDFASSQEAAQFSKKPVIVLEFLITYGAPHMPLPEYKQIVDEAKREIKEIQPDDLKNMQQKKENFTLIDVREPDEVAEGAIAGSKPLPRGQLEYKIDTITTDKNQPIVCYCGGGGRSALAAQSLQRMGFKNVSSLAGGYKGWKEEDK